MIDISVWQLVLFVLAGVALGAVVAMLALIRGKHVTEQAKSAPAPLTPGKAADPVESLATAASRQERVKTFLKNRITKKRNVSVDEASRALGVSPRRIRRLLDDGALVAVPVASGGRLVSAVSVLDLLLRREATMAKGSQETGPPPAPEKPIGVVNEPEPVETPEKPEPGPRQLYWYYVDGHDEPLCSIREALGVLGLNYAYTGWTDIPRNIRDKMRRERVQANVRTG